VFLCPCKPADNLTGRADPVALYARLSNNHRVFATNTVYIPEPPAPSKTQYPFADGNWGPNEYSVLPFYFDSESPYLAWIPLDYHPSMTITHKTLLTHRLVAGDIEYHEHERRGSMRRDLLKDIMDEVTYYRNQLPSYVQWVTQHEGTFGGGWSVKSVQPPRQALLRLRFASVLLDFYKYSYADMQLLVATARRAAVEILGFMSWVDDAEAWLHEKPRQSIYSARGAYANTLPEYLFLNKMRLPAYMIVPMSESIPANSRHVVMRSWYHRLSNRRREDVYPVVDHFWFGEPKVFHHLFQLHHYPPHVSSSDLFERTAREIIETRLDTHVPHPMHRKDHNRIKSKYEEMRSAERDMTLVSENHLRSIAGLRE
jgi:hypothetical protein